MTTKGLNVNGKQVTITIDDPQMPLLYALARQSRAQGTALRLRAGAMRRLHGAHRRQGGALLRHAAVLAQGRAEGRDAGGPGHAAKAPSAAAGLHRRAGRAVRLLHQRHDHGVGRVPRQEQKARPRRRSSRRSPTISAAAARMPASSEPSSAQPRSLREGAMNIAHRSLRGATC